jgi:flagellar FliL protein
MAAKPALKSVESAKGKAPATPGKTPAVPGKASATPATDDEVPAKKKSKLPLIVGVLALVLGAGGGAAWYFMGHAEPADKAEAAVEKVKKPSVYAPLEAFTVNLQGEGDHYLQVGITLQVADDAAVDEIKKQMPLLRNRLLLLLSARSPSELATLEGKQKLSAQILTESRELISGKGTDHGIEAVLFSSLVIQ